MRIVKHLQIQRQIKAIALNVRNERPFEILVNEVCGFKSVQLPTDFVSELSGT